MNTPNYTYMFYGFLAAWLVVIVYVISIALRERKLRQELDRVKRMLDEEHQSQKSGDRTATGS